VFFAQSYQIRVEKKCIVFRNATAISRTFTPFALFLYMKMME